MRRSLTRVALALTLLALTVPLGACRTSTLRIEIPGFADGDVDGLWFWRYSQDTQQFERSCRVDFSDPVTVKGAEGIEYVQMCDSVRAFAVTLAAPIERLSGGAIAVQLYFVRWEEHPGLFRASA